MVGTQHAMSWIIEVYNLLDEVVSEVAHFEYDTARYEFTLDATGLASGIYLYRLESTEFIETKKMILLRRFRIRISYLLLLGYKNLSEF